MITVVLISWFLLLFIRWAAHPSKHTYKTFPKRGGTPALKMKVFCVVVIMHTCAQHLPEEERRRPEMCVFCVQMC